MPCTDSAIGRFEKQNPTISVNVFGAEDKGTYCEIYPLRISETQRRNNEIDLLLINDEEVGSLHSNQHLFNQELKQISL